MTISYASNYPFPPLFSVPIERAPSARLLPSLSLYYLVCVQYSLYRYDTLTIIATKEPPFLLQPHHTRLPRLPPFSRRPADPRVDSLSAETPLLWTTWPFPGSISTRTTRFVRVFPHFRSIAAPTSILQLHATSSAIPFLGQTPWFSALASSLLSFSTAPLRCNAPASLSTSTVLQHQYSAAKPPTIFADDQRLQTFHTLTKSQPRLHLRGGTRNRKVPSRLPPCLLTSQHVAIMHRHFLSPLRIRLSR